MDLDLNGLEERVTQLVALCRRLRSENGTLRQQLVVAQNENKQLADRIDGAKTRIEALLERIPAAAAADEDED
jgi:cell division protein ZapB